MAEKDVYALNTVSNVVTKVDPSFLNHPILGKSLIEVDEPGVCIDCGDQPDSVSTADGDVIVLHDSISGFDIDSGSSYDDEFPDNDDPEEEN